MSVKDTRDSGCISVYRYNEVRKYKNLDSRVKIHIATCNPEKRKKSKSLKVKILSLYKYVGQW